ncbi:MAG: urease accessory protein ureD [Frankiales bacterium]|nr:urease accessory protein ureD [Frankiales bacterium]
MPLHSSARAVASCRDGRTYLSSLRSQVPLSLRPTAAGLTVVASAFGPLGGDTTALELVLEAGARLQVGSAGAQVAQPGVADPVSRASVRLQVGEGADLEWRPKPLVVTAGAEHRLELQVTAAAGSRLLLAETAVLSGGRYRSHWRVDYGQLPLLAADLDIGPGAPDGWDGPAGTDGARILLTALLAGEQLLRAGPLAGGEVLSLAGPGVLLQWLGDDAVEAQRCLDAFVAAASGVPAAHMSPPPRGGSSLNTNVTAPLSARHT